MPPLEWRYSTYCSNTTSSVCIISLIQDTLSYSCTTLNCFNTFRIFSFAYIIYIELKYHFSYVVIVCMPLISNGSPFLCIMILQELDPVGFYNCKIYFSNTINNFWCWTIYIICLPFFLSYCRYPTNFPNIWYTFPTPDVLAFYPGNSLVSVLHPSHGGD